MVESCEQLQQGFQQVSPGVTCTGTATTSCTCKIPVNDTSDETGTFTTSGNVATITTTGAGGGTSMIEYCVKGSSLKARQPGATSFIVLSK
jgi:hypothetical protein